MEVEEYDVRDGGRWRYTHIDPDGNRYGFHGVFHGTPTPDGMTQTFEFDGAPGHVSLDTLRLEERDGRTIARSHSVFQSVQARTRWSRAAWSAGSARGSTASMTCSPS